MIRQGRSAQSGPGQPRARSTPATRPGHGERAGSRRAAGGRSGCGWRRSRVRIAISRRRRRRARAASRRHWRRRSAARGDEPAAISGDAKLRPQARLAARRRHEREVCFEKRLALIREALNTPPVQLLLLPLPEEHLQRGFRLLERHAGLQPGEQIEPRRPLVLEGRSSGTIVGIIASRHEDCAARRCPCRRTPAAATPMTVNGVPLSLIDSPIARDAPGTATARNRAEAPRLGAVPLAVVDGRSKRPSSGRTPNTSKKLPATSADTHRVRCARRPAG